MLRWFALPGAPRAIGRSSQASRSRRRSVRVAVWVVPSLLCAAAGSAGATPASPVGPAGTVQLTPAGAYTTAFSFSAGQLVDNDSRPDSAVPPGTSSTFRTRLSTSAATLHIGATTTVRAGDAGSTTPFTVATTPLASGTTTAYPSAVRRFGGAVIETLKVTGPHRTRTLDDVIIRSTATDLDGAVQPSLSGNRLVYFAQTGTGHPAFFLYDVARDTVTMLESWTPQHWVVAPVISGSYLFYAKPDISYWREDLTTGHSTRILAPDGDNEAGFLFASGDYVAWEFITEDVITDGDDYDDEYENAAAGAAPSTAAGHLTSLSASGPVAMEETPDASEDYVLQTYSGDQVLLLTADGGPYQDPQVQGRTEAWVDTRSGALYVAPVNISPAPPRMSGDTLAPRPAHPAQVAWHPYVPYSEALTSCSVTISNAAGPVATLACNAAEMAIGVADVEWNGHIGSHDAPAGGYRYQITAAGNGGPALDSDGHAQPVSGHFTLNCCEGASGRSGARNPAA